MNESAFDVIAAAASVLKLDISSEEFAVLAEDSSFSEDAIEAVKTVFSYLKVTGRLVCQIMRESQIVADLNDFFRGKFADWCKISC